MATELLRREKRLYKSKSDYTIKRKHVLSTQGDIYESDHMTISPMDSLFSDQIPLYSDSNFKFSVRNTINMQKKHSRGNWSKHNDCGGGDLEIWTSDCMDYDFITPETEIKLKSNYNSLKDFAYYGSATDLVRSTINNVIMYFPAELYFSNIPLTVNGVKYYIIENDFQIDVHSDGIRENQVVNSMRYLSLNYYNYNFINSANTEYAINSWKLDVIQNADCNTIKNGVIASKVTLGISGGTIEIYVYMKGDEITLLYKDTSKANYKIRPIKSIIENYFNNINEFEKILVNRATDPIYRAVFDTPYETEYGIKSKKIDYIWPNMYGWNPCIIGSTFENYYNSLMEVANFHDNYDSDNIWRSMTHEAIKNLDWTFIRSNDSNTEDMSKIDTSRIEMMSRLYGRQYDDIKRYIDNIKFSNNVSYDGKNNTPDYFLTDICNIYGIDITNLNIDTDNTVKTPSLYKGMVEGFNSYETNLAIQTRLKQNLKYILSKKGTRSSIDIIMGMFGFDRDEYEIKEYVNVAKGKDGGYDRFNSTDTKYSGITYPLADDIIAINKERNDATFNMENVIPYKGLPLREVSVLMPKKNASGTIIIDDKGNTVYEYIPYVIPWFSKNEEYDGNLYFQMYGGWGKQESKLIDLEIAPNVSEILSDTGLTLYDETESYLKYARTLTDMLEIDALLLTKGDICYVTDIIDINTMYGLNTNETLDVNKMSHYFILENVNLSSTLGYSTNKNSYGWKNILLSEIESGNTVNGKKVLYLESIIDDTTGNNPHIGKGAYDNGKMYIDRMSNIFGYGIDNNLFTRMSDTDIAKMKNYVFTMTEYEDNRKSWYFVDISNDSGLHEMKQKEDANGYEKVTTESITLNVGNTDYANDIRKTSIIPYNPEGNVTYDEAAANSIINVKRMVINFKPKNRTSISTQTKTFIKYKVLPYIKQMIPSTTIFEYKITI